MGSWLISSIYLQSNIGFSLVSEYNKALMSDKKRGVAFVLAILQRRLASSTYAISRSLERRKKRLEDLIEGVERTDIAEKVFDFDEVEDLK